MIENNRYFWSHLKTKNASVRVQPREDAAGMVFLVNNVIDLGRGRQTVFLDHVDYPEASLSSRTKKAAPVPLRMGDLDFVYASRKTPVLRNVRGVMASAFSSARFEKIIVDVLSPGDVIIFRQCENAGKIKIAETLRLIKEETYTKSNRTEYAI
jgi:hypothetical protein